MATLDHLRGITLGIMPIWEITLHPLWCIIVVRDVQSCISGIRAGCRVCCDLEYCELRPLLSDVFVCLCTQESGGRSSSFSGYRSRSLVSVWVFVCPIVRSCWLMDNAFGCCVQINQLDATLLHVCYCELSTLLLMLLLSHISFLCFRCVLSELWSLLWLTCFIFVV